MTWKNLPVKRLLLPAIDSALIIFRYFSEPYLSTFIGISIACYLP